MEIGNRVRYNVNYLQQNAPHQGCRCEYLTGTITFIQDGTLIIEWVDGFQSHASPEILERIS